LCTIRILFLIIFWLGCRTSYLLLRARLLDHPVEDEVILVAHAIEQIFKEFSQVTNVGLLLEFETSAIVKINSKLVW